MDEERRKALFQRMHAVQEAAYEAHVQASGRDQVEADDLASTEGDE